MNMPKKEVYGSQPPCELIRQIIDNKEMDLNCDRYQLEDITVLAAMETSGGLPRVTNRLLRHFNVMTDTELGKETMSTIFSQLLSHFHQGFSPFVRNIHSQMISAGISLYEQTRNKLTTSNDNPHYNFHFRDVWKVFRGISNASSTHTRWAKDALKLWYNENMRVYYDRLSCGEDRTSFKDTIDGFFPEFGFEKEEVMTSDVVMFENFTADGYKEISDVKEFTEHVKSVQSCAGQQNENVQKLVMFDEAVEHCARIARAINQNRGNALVLGNQGTGRKSVSRMASYLTGIPLQEVNQTDKYSFKDWRIDLKNVMMRVGLKNKQVCFLVSADQLPS